jgi:hypothetical protein
MWMTASVMIIDSSTRPLSRSPAGALGSSSRRCRLPYSTLAPRDSDRLLRIWKRPPYNQPSCGPTPTLPPPPSK